MSSALSKALRIISAVFAGVVILLALLLVGVRLFGVEVMAVLSPSMEPKYPTGSLIYVTDVEPQKLEVNDVITFRVSGDTTATHRIIEIIPDENSPDIIRFRTKGDNNDTVDGALVEMNNVIGKPIFCIPHLGRLAMYIQSPPGSYVAIGVGIAMILFVVIVDMVTNDKKDKKNKSCKGENSDEEN